MNTFICPLLNQASPSKYYLSICAIFKNEAHILEEWITHYLDEGVEYFYLIDNGSTDCYQSILHKFVDVVTLFVDDKKHCQTEHYNNYVFPLKDESEWLMIIDLDEFAYSRKEFCRIPDYLKSLPSDVASVSMPWKMFGSSGYIDQPSNVVNNFLYRSPHCSTFFGCKKQIVRTRILKKLIMHTHETVGGGRTINSDNTLFYDYNKNNVMSSEETELFLSNSFIHINHYAIQSYNWFKNVKCTRGDASSAESDNVRNDHYFQAYDNHEVFDDELFLKKNKTPLPFEIGTDNIQI